MIPKLTLLNIDTPVFVQNSFEWSIGQYDYKFNAPYDRHKLLTEGVEEVKERLDEAVENGDNEDVVLRLQLEYCRVSQELSEFIEPYIHFES